MSQTRKKKSAIKWIYGYCRNYLWMVLLLSFVSMGIAAGFIALAVASREIIDAAMGNGKSIRSLCGPVIGIILLQCIGNVLNSNLRVRCRGRIENTLQRRMIEQLLKKQYAQVTAFHSGELINRLSSDIEIVSGGIVGFLPQLISLITKLLAGIGVMFAMDKTFSFLVLGGGAILTITSRLYSRRFRYLHKEAQSTLGVVKSFMQECLENLVVVKSFSKETLILNELHSRQDKNFKIRIKQTAVSNIASTAVYFLTSAGYYITIVWGALQISKGLLTFGTLTAFLQILEQIKAPFRNLSGLIPQYDNMIASAERLMELEDLPDEEKREETASTVDTANDYGEIEEICLEDCCFSYGEKDVWSHATISFPINTVTAIVGESGNGKSTLFYLLLGLYDITQGNVYFHAKNRNGNDKKIKIDASTRAFFAYVPQGNLILSGTIRENICFGSEHAGEEAIQEAIRIACLDDVIQKLPDGLDTLLGERGIGLSEGQKQRIAIARAILSNAPILLMDECTSALDSSTEKRLLSHLRELKNRTVLFISHREAAMETCDQMVLIQNGKMNYV